MKSFNPEIRSYMIDDRWEAIFHLHLQQPKKTDLEKGMKDGQRKTKH